MKGNWNMYDWDDCINCENGKIQPTGNIKNGHEEHQCDNCKDAGYWVPQGQGSPTFVPVYGDYTPAKSGGQLVGELVETPIHRQETVRDLSGLFILATFLLLVLAGVAGIAIVL